MTQSLSPQRPVPREPDGASPAPVTGTAGPGRLRRVLAAVAIGACGPYIGIKAAWIAGSHVGIPDGSSLLDHRTAMIVANGVTVLMDAAVVLLALVLTRPWGRRTPVWLLTFPAWVATGLLAPIMTGFPLQLLVKALGGSVTGESDTGRKPFLDEWVFGVVYTGFILQGLALGTLFVLYARDRWGHLWRGRVWELPVSAVGAAQRVCAVAACLAALLPLTVHFLWAVGSGAGLNEGRADGRTSDFYVLEAMDVLFLLATLAGALVLAFRRAPALPVRLPLALAWVGSGAVTWWGAYLLLVPLGGVDDIADRPTQLMNLTYAVQVIVGILVAALGVHFFAERSARASKRPPA